MNEPLRIVELFAGVGGFRLGLESINTEERENLTTIWSNQWEPCTKTTKKNQHASSVYVREFGLSQSKDDFIFHRKNKKGKVLETHVCKDIHPLSLDAKNVIPDHDILVGGFPCQDYSVAKTLSQSKGIEGKKGVLWWDIHRILKAKKPPFVLLENVDRLLKSPATQRGRDFAIMLASLSDLGYSVEWRIVNAADYGMPQRRRRVFVMAYLKGTSWEKSSEMNKGWILEKGILGSAFPCSTNESENNPSKIKGSLDEITENFSNINKDKERDSIRMSINKRLKEMSYEEIKKFAQKETLEAIAGRRKSPFMNAGFMSSRKYLAFQVEAEGGLQDKMTIRDILQPKKEIPKEFWLGEEGMDKWRYLKGAKKETRKTEEGYEYPYNEGPMVFPDSLDKPSRTIVTGEGGKTPSRFKHVIKQGGKLRRLIPEELELLNMFPKGHTKDVPDAKRAFLMGNALVVGVVEKIGESLIKQINSKNH